ncbi:MAG: hypothetical protein HYU51_16400 [Candidatus Rokubacteria bacterium]|nr:hypothetical protein [Candidatus Rokubacteria bacterium]
MRTMGATVLDVAAAYRDRITGLPLTGAFMLYDRPRNTIVFITFFESVDEKAESELASVEASMVDAFGEFFLDFRTIHLMGRDLAKFIPAGAIPLLPAPGPAFHRASR